MANTNTPNNILQEALEASQRNADEERMAQLQGYLGNANISYKESLAVNEAVRQSNAEEAQRRSNEMRRVFNESVAQEKAEQIRLREQKLLAEKQQRTAEQEARRLAKEERRAATLAEEARKAEEKRAQDLAKRRRDQEKAAAAKQRKQEKASKKSSNNNNLALLEAAIGEAKSSQRSELSGLFYDSRLLTAYKEVISTIMIPANVDDLEANVFFASTKSWILEVIKPFYSANKSVLDEAILNQAKLFRDIEEYIRANDTYPDLKRRITHYFLLCKIIMEDVTRLETKVANVDNTSSVALFVHMVSSEMRVTEAMLFGEEIKDIIDMLPQELVEKIYAYRASFQRGIELLKQAQKMLAKKALADGYTPPLTPVIDIAGYTKNLETYGKYKNVLNSAISGALGGRGGYRKTKKNRRATRGKKRATRSRA